jgi:hypothetical protein
MPREFDHEAQTEIDATPEQLWEAIATGPGGMGDMAGIGHHLFAEDVDQQQSEQAWQAWLSGLFA